ncbi:MAG: hypothetical protein M3O30_13910 [Planctomycetota bacterium]|nr:hypothetical protein [Planctomycetota bacterium]
MKILFAMAFGLLLFSAIRSASAQFIVGVDENGGGTTLTPGGLISTPVTLSSPPVYHLGPVFGFVPTPGDVIVTDGTPANPTNSDLLRFTANGDLFIYSDINATENDPKALADVGVPTTFQSNAISLPETNPNGGTLNEAIVNGLFGYFTVAGSGLPGSAPGGTGATITYNFTSDLPEPASLTVVGLVSTGLLARRRRPLSAA